MTIRTMTRVAILAVPVLGFLSPEAAAWGTRAQRSVTMMVIKGDFYDVFRRGEDNYERDVLRGSEDGHAVIRDDVPLNSDAETVEAVGSEIQLLREVLAFGPSSYFAYRMGVLAALVSDIMVPYGFAWSPEEERIQKMVLPDIDGHLDSYGFEPKQRSRIFIRDVQAHFKAQRSFYHDDKIIIATDYRSGAGYDGFLSQGGPAYFALAAEAVADAWYTVLRHQPDATHASVSRRTLAWYFVEEIEYLLSVKRNIRQADKTYGHFATINPDLVEAYEKVGDLYYAFGSPEAIDRGVREWTIAHGMGGTDRRRIATKLCAHYLGQGRSYLESASRPGAKETDLSNALNAFELALNFDRTNQDAADLIQETNVAIEQRHQRFEMTVSIIATGEKVHEEAEKARLQQDFGNAIKTYRQAIGFFEAVDDEFKEQETTAKENIRKLKKNVRDVIIEVIDKASDAVDQGERLREENKYEEAINAYSAVPGIVAVIPDDENPTITAQKQEMIDLSSQKIEETKSAKIRYEQAVAEQEEAAKRGR